MEWLRTKKNLQKLSGHVRPTLWSVGHASGEKYPEKKYPEKKFEKKN